MVYFGSGRDFRTLQEDFSNLKNKVDKLESDIRILTINKKYQREKFAVDLISKWATSIDSAANSTRKVVEHLSETDCGRINLMLPLNISANHQDKDRMHQKLLKISLEREIDINNDRIELDEDSVATLRWHTTKYLNLLESIMVAWQRGLAEPEIIEEEFKFLRSDTGNTFALFNYRENLVNVQGQTFDPYPAIRQFENKISLRPDDYEQARNNYLESIANKVEAKSSVHKSEGEAIRETVDELLNEYRKKKVEERFDIVRYLASESAKTGFSIIAQKAFEHLFLFLA